MKNDFMLKIGKLFNADSRFLWLANKGFFKHMPDEEYLKRFYKAMMHKKLNLNNPITYNEKIQWLKLNDRKDIYTSMVDKYEVKELVKNVIGNEYIIPTLGVYDNFKSININTLPDKFVIKCTHDSGGLYICQDKSHFNIKKARKIINTSLKRNYYWIGREWPYKNVKPRIIIEKYMEDSETKELRDYKFFCFNGKVKALFIATDRQKVGEKVKFDYFDDEFNHLDCKQSHENADVVPQKPAKFEEMKIIAEKLSQGLPHVRVDLYEVNGHVYFGEMTFSHYSGVERFYPEKWDYYFGKMIDLSVCSSNCSNNRQYIEYIN